MEADIREIRDELRRMGDHMIHFDAEMGRLSTRIADRVAASVEEAFEYRDPDLKGAKGVPIPRKRKKGDQGLSKEEMQELRLEENRKANNRLERFARRRVEERDAARAEAEHLRNREAERQA